ncbi:MAG: TolC family protein [Bdellovibrionales bacterium]|nr:TolC family protein [Bdellovibrionales bacterium]
MSHKIFAFFTFVFVLSAQASDEPICPNIKSALDIMQCLRTKQPAFAAAKNLRTAEEDARRGGVRWLNPEIQSQGLAGRSLGNEQVQLQVALYQPIQTGGKRQAQVLSGEANALGLQARSRLEQGQALKLTALGLYRFKQLSGEIAAIQEAAETFKKLVIQYQGRPRLTPEQEVSLSIFRLAQGDYELRLIEKKNEEQQVLNFFQAQLGIDLSRYIKILPLYQEPSEKELSSFSPEQLTKKSPELLSAQSELTQAHANAFQARGDAFSDISVGPMMGINRDGPIQQNLFGIALNIPFPVWNQNGYQVAAAQKQADLLEHKIKIRESEIELEIKRTLATIQAAKSRLSTLPSQTNLHQKHEQVEKNFFRGLVSPAIIVEAHRALVDFLIQRHQSENFVMGNLWDLYMIADRLEEKQL